MVFCRLLLPRTVFRFTGILRIWLTIKASFYPYHLSMLSTGDPTLEIGKELFTLEIGMEFFLNFTDEIIWRIQSTVFRRFLPLNI